MSSTAQKPFRPRAELLVDITRGTLLQGQRRLEHQDLQTPPVPAFGYIIERFSNGSAIIEVDGYARHQLHFKVGEYRRIN